jgi:hypothetical protein
MRCLLLRPGVSQYGFEYHIMAEIHKIHRPVKSAILRRSRKEGNQHPCETFYAVLTKLRAMALHLFTSSVVFLFFSWHHQVSI